MKVRAMVNMEYPVSQKTRNAIRRGEKIQMEERGRIEQIAVGQEFEAPGDLLPGWLARGFVEEVPEQPQPESPTEIIDDHQE